MQTERLSLGERASNLFNALTGTWSAALFWTALTVAWWLHSPPPGGWAKAVADDAYPFTFWGALVSYITLVQEIIIRTGQRAQQRRAERADQRQAAIIDAVRQDVEATEAAVLALHRVLAHQEDDTARLMEQMRLVRAEMDLVVQRLQEVFPRARGRGEGARHDTDDYGNPDRPFPRAEDGIR